MKSTRQILQDARDYLAKPGTWTQGMACMSRVDEPVIVAMCAGYAVMQSAAQDDSDLAKKAGTAPCLLWDHGPHMEAFAVLNKHLPAYIRHSCCGSRIIAFNDSAKSKEEVLAVFDKAIAEIDRQAHIDKMKNAENEITSCWIDEYETLQPRVVEPA